MFTKGPWKKRYGCAGYSFFEDENGDVILVVDESVGRPIVEEKANMELAVSSPELFSLLERFAEELPGSTGPRLSLLEEWRKLKERILPNNK